jgi:hypothetical protein
MYFLLMAAASLHLSNRYAGEKTLNPITEGTIIFLFFIIILLGSLLYCFMNIPPTYNAKNEATATINTYPSLALENCNTLAQLFGEEVSFTVNQNTCPASNCTDVGLLVSLQGSVGSFQISKEVQNDPGVWLFQTSLASNAYSMTPGTALLVA